MSTELSTDTENDVADTLLDRLRLATAGTYDIAGVLGRGGMAVVFVAEDLRLRRTVAIKVMEPSLSLIPGMAERFLEEARTLARLQHPNVIVVHDVQRSKGLNFFVMTLIEGGGVDELCRHTNPLPIDQAQWILLGAARALAFAHSERIVHRDVKPANILVNVKGDVVLTDFGIAKGVDGTGLTKSGTQIGTPVYMSPEQFTGEHVGPASDQYALGVTAYQLLTGAPPFSGELYALIAAHGTRVPVPIRQLRPDCPASLANAVMRMLEKLPQDRWPSLDDLSDFFGANLPNDGGATRRKLATAARALHVERTNAVQALNAQPPLSPVPTHASRVTAAPVVPNLVVTVSPPGATIFVGGSLELRASATLENGQPVTNAAVQWTSSEPAIVTVDATGRLVGIAAGTAVIRAALDGGASEARIAVEAAPIARISIPSSVITMRVGDDLRPVVSVVDVTGATRTDVSLIWASHSADVARVEQSGTIQALGAGRTVVEVSVGNLRQRLDVTVVPRPITRVSIQPVPPRVELGATRQLVLHAVDDRGQPVAAVMPQWHSSASAVIHVDSSGRALAISPGSARISVAVDEVTDVIELVAIESPVAGLDLQVESRRLEVEDEVPVGLRVTDTTGGIRSAESVRVWTSDAAIAVVDESRMMLRAIAPGALFVYAQSIVDGVPGVSTTLPVAVLPPAAVRMDTEPAQIDLDEGASTTVTIRVRDRRGRPVSAPIIVWTSESGDVATVDGLGVVTGRSVGSGIICARITNPDGTTLESRVPVLVRPGATIAGTPEPPTLRAPNFTPVTPTVPLPRPEGRTATPSGVPVAPTVPLPRPERDATPPRPTPVTAQVAVPVAVAPLRATPISAAAVPPEVASGRASAGSQSAVQDSPARATLSDAPAVAGSATSSKSSPRGLMIGGGVLVAALAVWAIVPSRTGTTPTSVPRPTVEPAPAAQRESIPASSVTRPPEPTVNRAPPVLPPVAVSPPTIAKPKATATATARTSTATAGGRPLNTPTVATPQPAKPAAPPGVVQSVVDDPRKAAVSPLPSVGPISLPPSVPVATPAGPSIETTSRRPDPPRVVEMADAGELRSQAERFLARVRSGAERDGELAAFYNEDADHKVTLVGAPVVTGERNGRTVAQFDMRLVRYDGGGRQRTRVATVTMDVVKRDGAVSTVSASVSALRSPR